MSDKPDLSALLAMLSNNNDKKNINPEELLANLMNSSNEKNSQSNTSENSTVASSNNMPDMEMMMKLMHIMKTSNQDSPSKELLKSLKPFLNDSRKEKVDQYIKILGMTKAFELLNELGDKPK